jgi:hypothetical protein
MHGAASLASWVQEGKQAKNARKGMQSLSIRTCLRTCRQAGPQVAASHADGQDASTTSSEYLVWLNQWNTLVNFKWKHDPGADCCTSWLISAVMFATTSDMSAR